ESGQFTNQGDGGWINWAFKGWFDRNGQNVTVRKP
ncbi:stress response protein YvgO, partial [Bacillus haynesii]|nr:stress response protein YvgO [Bacillus haynesii]